MGLTCNICGSNEFKPFGVIPRSNAQCKQCNSLERHRAVHYFLNRNGMLEGRVGKSRCLQLAPEKVTHDYLAPAFGTGYFAADLFPSKYKYARCLKLDLPDGFQIFPEQYFNLIVHNHVLEHIPGSFKSHIDEFHRLLAPDGVMAFTIPGYRIMRGGRETKEGGEFLATDADRIREHGQGDHYKTFGTDLIDYLQTKFSKFEALLLNDNDLSKNLRTDHNASGVVFWCAK